MTGASGLLGTALPIPDLPSTNLPTDGPERTRDRQPLPFRGAPRGNDGLTLQDLRSEVRAAARGALEGGHRVRDAVDEALEARGFDPYELRAARRDRGAAGLRAVFEARTRDGADGADATVEGDDGPNLRLELEARAAGAQLSLAFERSDDDFSFSFEVETPGASVEFELEFEADGANAFEFDFDFEYESALGSLSLSFDAEFSRVSFPLRQAPLAAANPIADEGAPAVAAPEPDPIPEPSSDPVSSSVVVSAQSLRLQLSLATDFRVPGLAEILEQPDPLDAIADEIVDSLLDDLEPGALFSERA